MTQKILLASILLLPLLFSCTSSFKKDIQVKENNPRFDHAPYVLHISIDGYRHDYNKLYNPPTLTKFAQEGVRLQSLIPSFPTNTFPNHFTQVTGCHPGRHGIVNNHFYDPELKEKYSLKDRDSLRDGRFYTCDPLWVSASKNHMVSASFFWPGSEAPISDHYPSHYLSYNRSTPHRKRINQVLKWLKLPLKKRPHYINLYFSDVDSAGHIYGPRSPKVKKAIFKVDRSLKILFNKIKKLNLPINIIITSDHGMSLTKKPITFGDKNLLQSFSAINGGAFSLLYYKGKSSKKQQAVNQVVKKLSGNPLYQVYKREDLPLRFHGNNNPRFGDVIVLARLPRTVKPPSFLGSVSSLKGKHGYDPQYRDMHGILFAKGPGFKKKTTLPPKESIHIYPLIAHLLGLSYSSENQDGRFEKIKDLLSLR